MKRLALLLLAANACVPIHVEKRTERGPLLRTLERDVPPSPGGIRARAEAHWPQLTLTFTSYQTCRHERVEVYAEDDITEKTSAAAGPQIATGISTSLVGAVLLATQGLFSNAPNTRNIDGGGNYGPSDRTLAKTWSYALLILGVPALAMGAAGLIQSGEETKTREVEQVTSAKDARCEERPLDGKVVVVAAEGAKGPVRETQNGTLTLAEADLRGIKLLGFTLDDRPVVLAKEEMPPLEHYLACLDVLPSPDATALAQESLERLQERADLIHGCAAVADAPVKEVAARVELELDKRRLGGQTSDTPRAGPATFEAAVASNPPALKLMVGGDDVARLKDATPWLGKAVYAKGLLVERVEANIAVVEVGAERLWVFIPPDAPWATSLDNGSRVELIGLVQGRQTLGSLDAPLVRALWMRPAM